MVEKNTQIAKFDVDYRNWVALLSQRYRRAQIKAAWSVNSVLLSFYWDLGRDITQMQAENKYGSSFFEVLSNDLKTAIPEAKGLSPTNLKYIRRFYLMYHQVIPQLEEITAIINRQQVAAKSSNQNRQQVADESSNQNRQQVVAKSDGLDNTLIGNILFQIPWGHHTLLIDKFFNEPQAAIFYIRQTIDHGWSRAVLLNMLDTKLHLRQGKAITNFKAQLPEHTSELAQELTKDPYIFDFTNLTIPFKERELKNEILKNITKFLLELGDGFAFVGQEYRLNIGQTEQFTDLLFYHLKLRCYVVIELKVTKFEPGFLGQLGMYVTAVDHLLKTEVDNPTIGLLICKDKDEVLAQYSLEGYNLPIGISNFELDKFIPKDFKSALPSIEDIESFVNSIE